MEKQRNKGNNEKQKANNKKHSYDKKGFSDLEDDKKQRQEERSSDLSEESEDNKKKRKKKKRIKKKPLSKVSKSIFFSITCMFFIIYIVVMLLTVNSSETFSVTAYIKYNGEDYDVSYIFEHNLENIFYNTEAGDKFPIRKMTFNDINGNFEIIKVDRENSYFETNLPRTISTNYYSLNQYENNKSGKVNVYFRVKTFFGLTNIMLIKVKTVSI